METDVKRTTGFSVASLVLSIIGICTSFIPIINNLSFMLAIIAIIFSIVALFKKAGKGMAIAGIILSLFTIMFVISAQKTLSDTIDTAVNQLNDNIDQITGNKTEDLLANNVDVTIGDFSVTEDSYGLTDTLLPVTVKNKSSEVKSFQIQVEAVDANGSRLDIDYIYANNLGANQSQQFKLFQFIESDKLDSMKNAQFKIVEVSMY